MNMYRTVKVLTDLAITWTVKILTVLYKKEVYFQDCKNFDSLHYAWNCQYFDGPLIFFVLF